jgi:bromodomain-containing factor 1
LTKKVHEPYSYPFLVAVDPVALNIPDYPKIIKQPMDLGTIDTKLKEQQYGSGDEFYADVKLVFKNCYRYNGIDSPVAQLAKQLEKVFDKKWLEKPEDPPEKPNKRGPSSSPHEDESSSDEDEIGRIQEQMTAMAKRLSEMQSRKKQRHEKSPTLKGKGGKSKKGHRLSGGQKPKKKEYIPDVTFEQKRELSEKINFLSPSKMQGVLELIKDAMPLDSV